MSAHSRGKGGLMDHAGVRLAFRTGQVETSTAAMEFSVAQIAGSFEHKDDPGARALVAAARALANDLGVCRTTLGELATKTKAVAACMAAARSTVDDLRQDCGGGLRRQLCSSSSEIALSPCAVDGSV
ncbi:MAG TPA: hypothetical protein VNE67_17270 [Acetobacteraceae bacterium]|nr:hypothetical protein [Stellaceae bacterium]HVB69602.1 hypothetical protein [Acetobacteraceae bacterium]